MKLYNNLIAVLIVLLVYMSSINADVMDDFIKSISPELSRKQAIRFAMEKTFEIQSEDNLKRKLNLYADNVTNIKITAKHIGLTKEQLDSIIHELGYTLAKDIMSDGVYSVEEIREYANLIESNALIINEVIEGINLEIHLKKLKRRNELIRSFMDAGFPSEVAKHAISIGEKEEETKQEKE